MKLKPLAWDSRFFKIKIASLSLQRKEDLEHLSEMSVKAKGRGFRLLYVFSPFALSGTGIFLPAGGRKVDEKVVYRMPLQRGHKTELPLISVLPYKKTAADKMLVGLELQSGVYSRFKCDRGFRTSDYKRLYTLWIQKSVRKEIADAVLVSISPAGRLTGFVTLKKKKDEAVIDLIGVDKKSRGKGLGAALVREAKAWALSKKARFLSVATQKENEPACGLYEKMGFTRHSSTFVYHFWL